jgi:hypothetical protein
MMNFIRNLKPWPLRLLLAGPTVVAGLLVWNAVTRLAKVQRENQVLNEQNNRLAREVSTLERKWSPELARELKARYEESLHRLEGGNQLVSLWLQQANDRMVPLALDLTPQFGTPIPRPIGEATVTFVPAMLEVRSLPMDGLFRTPYQRLLDLSLHLSTQSNRADLMELSVTTSTNAQAKATLNFNIWTKEPSP